MDKTLASFLKTIELWPYETSLDLNELYVKKIDLAKEEMTLSIYVESKKSIDDDKLHYLSKDIKNKVGLNYVTIVPQYSKMTEKGFKRFYKSYASNIIKMLASITPSIKAFTSSVETMILDGKLYIKLPNEMIYKKVINSSFKNEVKLKLKKELNMDLDIVIEFNCDDCSLTEFVDAVSCELESYSSSYNSVTEDDEESETYVLDYEEMDDIIYGENIPNYFTPVNELTLSTVCINVKVFDSELKELKNGKTLLRLFVTDSVDSIECRAYLDDQELYKLKPFIIPETQLIIKGDIIDKEGQEVYLMITGIKIGKKNERFDDSDEKRVELHAHTNMTSMDAVASAKELISKAKKWGHKAIAITDKGVVQAYPDAMTAGSKNDIKIIYGLEGEMVDDDISVFEGVDEYDFNSTFIVFDLETTGLSPVNDMITEIGAVKIKNMEIVDRFTTLVNPNMDISYFIQSLTGITNDMVKDSPSIEDVMPDFLEFIEDGVMVAHNANFDIGFLNKKIEQLGLFADLKSIDTLIISRALFPESKKHTLDVISKKLSIPLLNHHRAVEDAEATANIYIKILEILRDRGASDFKEANSILGYLDYKRVRPNHVTLYAKNQVGIKNIYKIVSASHINYLAKDPLIPRKIIQKYREGIIIGSSCNEGEIFKAIRSNEKKEKIDELIDFYDIIELMPVENLLGLLERGEVKDSDEIRDIYKKMYVLAKEHNKIPVATGNVHYINKEDGVYRDVLAKSIKYKRIDTSGYKYFRTTAEMLDEFSYLGEEKAYEVVIKNTNEVSNMIDDVIPIPKETFPPVIDGSDEELRRLCYSNAAKVYGENLPDIVKSRLDRELNSIISNGYAVMYIIAHKLVAKSLSDGYLVGSRGSVGSSFAATMAEITEVNPLPAHYICPNENCKHNIFFEVGEKGSGVDLDDMYCPKCSTKMIKEGHDIPFEVFLGFEGDKEPDIDLNFSGVYQSTIHKYTEELFGKGYVYRAGTIGTVADKTAFGLAKKYSEEKNLNLRSAEIRRLAKGCTGVKRTSGQHPGGVMVVPDYKDIYDFTPIQYPANEPGAGTITTHFDYHSISGRILKLDILGHDGPTILRMLEDITGIKVTEIPLDDKKTMSLFTSTDALGVSPEDIGCKVGSLAIPEFGTRFVRQMLLDTKPTTFTELVRISGLSHGTDVWLNNAQDLVRSDIVGLKDVISTRDDIMNYLIFKGLKPKLSFTIMERVRKGKGLEKEHIDEMVKNEVPQWYIDSCQKIKYMFPKAHAVAYVMTSFRIAYCKVYYPEAFYATYFTTKVEDFDSDLVIKGLDTMKDTLQNLEENLNYLTAKEKNLVSILEVAIEMYARKIEIVPIDLYKSDVTEFKVYGEGKILPPLSSLVGVGENAARNIVSEREKGAFKSKEDLRKRCKLARTAIDALEAHGSLKNLGEENQISFKDLN